MENDGQLMLDTRPASIDLSNAWWEVSTGRANEASRRGRGRVDLHVTFKHLRNRGDKSAQYRAWLEGDPPTQLTAGWVTVDLTLRRFGG